MGDEHISITHRFRDSIQNPNNSETIAQSIGSNQAKGALADDERYKVRQPKNKNYSLNLNEEEKQPIVDNRYIRPNLDRLGKHLNKKEIAHNVNYKYMNSKVKDIRISKNETLNEVKEEDQEHFQEFLNESINSYKLLRVRDSCDQEEDKEIPNNHQEDSSQSRLSSYSQSQNKSYQNVQPKQSSFSANPSLFIIPKNEDDEQKKHEQSVNTIRLKNNFFNKS